MESGRGGAGGSSGTAAHRLRHPGRRLCRLPVPQSRAGGLRSPPTTQAATMLTIGSVLDDRYEIRKILGVGGMGVVYRAHDRELDEAVAIKTLKPDAMQDGTSLERFKQEIRLARRITHRNVV